MRPLYFLLYLSLGYALRLFYRKRISINQPQKRHSGTIYVSNHPNSFMDPLTIGLGNYAIVQFMTRSDVFKWWLKPVLWASNMLPIFRQHDGADTKRANSDSFRQVNKSLIRNRNILIFGEGFTDDIPIRSLKPVKKGPVRMGFSALEACNWEKEICVAPIGVNYTDRNTIGSEVVICNSELLRLNDYREAFEQQPSKTINELTKVVEQRMQDAIIYVRKKDWAPFHENIMRITRKGFNADNRNPEIELQDRWKYGKNLAEWLNDQDEDDTKLLALKKETENYFGLLKRMKAPDFLIPDSENPYVLNRNKELAFILLLWPFMLLGLVHGAIPYFITKKLTEKLFGRKVFWGSVKMVLGKFLGMAYNIPLIILMNRYLFPENWMGWVYLCLVPLLCFIAYNYFRNFSLFITKGKLKKMDLSAITAKKEKLKQEIKELIPVA